ncbi:tRNA N6-adenosine threonylcarbamoyltransferase [Dirofilaria immitis]
MRSNTAVIITIGICATVATGLFLFHYFRKKKERGRKKISLEKQMELAERLPFKRRGRFQISRQVMSPKHVSHMKKLFGSGKKRYITSSETSGNKFLSTKSDISSISKKIKTYSPSCAETLETGSSISSSEKSRSQYSSENYPPAIIRRHKESPKLQLSLEKSEKSRDTTIKSVESIGVKKLLTAEEIPSSTDIIPIDSYCYCGQDMAISSYATGELNEKCKVELLPTIVKPVSFDPYSPEDLTQVEGSSDEMSKNSMQINSIPKNHHIIVPFLPILHAITYASKHAQLLQELLQNYEYFESQALESS